MSELAVAVLGLSSEDGLALRGQPLNVVVDELPQVGLALHNEVIAHPGEPVRPDLRGIERELPDLFLVQETAHASLLQAATWNLRWPI
jgi:hypothetical protein